MSRRFGLIFSSLFLFFISTSFASAKISVSSQVPASPVLESESQIVFTITSDDDYFSVNKDVDFYFFFKGQLPCVIDNADHSSYHTKASNGAIIIIRKLRDCTKAIGTWHLLVGTKQFQQVTGGSIGQFLDYEFAITASLKGDPVVIIEPSVYQIGSRITGKVTNASPGDVFSGWWFGDKGIPGFDEGIATTFKVGPGQTEATFTARGQKDPKKISFCLALGELHAPVSSCTYKSGLVEFVKAGDPKLSGPQTPITVTPNNPYTGAQNPSTGQCKQNKNFWDNFDPIEIIQCSLQNVIGGITGIFVTLAGNLIGAVLEQTKSITSSSGIAAFGFKISLQIVNLFFVVGLIIIAFGTMLRQSFGAKLLPKFLLMAFLMYFSFSIAASIVTFSDSVTITFMKAANFNGDNFKNVFGGSLGGGIFSGIAGILGSLAFSGLLILTLFAVAAMFMIRFVSLNILFILLPFAVFFSAFPIDIGGASGLWKRWQEQFVKWIIFGPIAMFFVFLAIKLLEIQPKGQGDIATISNGIAVIGILMGGLMAASELGITGAKYFDGLKTAGFNKAKGWAKGRASSVGAGLKQRALNAGQDDKGNPLIERAARRLAITPFLNRILPTKQMLVGLGVARKKTTEQVAEEQKKIADITKIVDNDAFMSTARNELSGPLRNPVLVASVAAEAAKRNVIGRFTAQQQEQMLRAAKVTNTQNAILQNRPDLAPQADPTITPADAIGNIMRSIPGGKGDQISQDSIEDYNDPTGIGKTDPDTYSIIRGLSAGHLAKMGTDGTPEQIRKFRDQLRGRHAASHLVPPQTAATGGVDLADRRQFDTLIRWMNKNPQWL